MNNAQKANRFALVGNLLFFVFVLLSLLCGAFAVTTENKTILIVMLSLAGVSLVAGTVLVYVFRRCAGKYLALAKAEAAEAAAVAEAKADEEALGEDGLPYAFCKEIRGYSPAQLRLILDEQAEEYTAAETAFIKKVLRETD